MCQLYIGCLAAWVYLWLLSNVWELNLKLKDVYDLFQAISYFQLLIIFRSSDSEFRKYFVESLCCLEVLCSHLNDATLYRASILVRKEGTTCYKLGLNMLLIPALSSDFAMGPSTFFCLALVPAFCKMFGFSPSVKSQLKKTKLMVCHVDQSFDVMWHTKRQKNQLFNYYFIRYFLDVMLLFLI